MRWLPLALAVVCWQWLVGVTALAGRTQPAFRWLALLVAFVLPVVGIAILLRGPDLRSVAGRRLRLWAHLATLAPVIATVLRVLRFLPPRLTWLALFGGLLIGSFVRGGRSDPASSPSPTPLAAPPTFRPPPALLLRLHRWAAVVLVGFVLLHVTCHLSAVVSLQVNSWVVDAARLIYKQPPLEALLLLAALVQIVTGVWLFIAFKDHTRDRWDRLQLAAGLYLALFIAGHTTATAILFRDLTFRGASGGSAGMLGDPSFLAYYVFAPLSVFAHLAAGLRRLTQRRLGRAPADRLATGVLALGAAATLVITLALSGVHLHNDRHRLQPRPAKVTWG